MAPHLTEEILAQIASTSPQEAMSIIASHDLLTLTTAEELAQAVLSQADEAPARAERWLIIAEQVQEALAGSDDIAGLLHYARARLRVTTGELGLAADELMLARDHWRNAGNRRGVVRSTLGESQLLAMQGDWEAAETILTDAITTLGAAVTGEDALLALDLRQNLATLYSYQERHREALEAIGAIHIALSVLLETASEAEITDLEERLGLVERDLALAYTFLDQPQRAEQALGSAIERLTRVSAITDRGRARTNLAHLLARTGRYGDAVRELDSATLDLLNTLDVETATDAWPAADVLFLEQATTYLALNLLPEAALALDRAVRLFSETGQQYELGQAQYYVGLLAIRRNDANTATAALTQASTQFTLLANTYWQHRVAIAQAGLAMQVGDLDAARRRLTPLLEELAAGESAPMAIWDLPSRVELKILAARVQLQRGDLAVAHALADSALLDLGAKTPDDPALASLPHLGLKLVHTLGMIARAEGNLVRARELFSTAIALMEAQRASLPLEEFRTAYLADKTDLYTDLVLSLLDEPAPDANAVAEAFAVVERARSRALLERLLAAVDEDTTSADTPTSAAEQATFVRRELSWLYNRLLGAGDGSRHTWPQLNGEIQALEATLQRLEWQAPEWMVQAEPATLFELQASLHVDQIALVYYCAGEELMAFVVNEEKVEVVRQVCSTAELSAALAELRFQLGRVEIGDQYLSRHQTRLLTGAKHALSRLHALVLAPLRDKIGAKRLLIVPHGELHILPFHALWDGHQYLLEQFTVTYASSASLVVHQRKTSPARTPVTLSALAIRDAAIPQAEAEVHAAGRHFSESHLYLEEEAGFEGLFKAAAEADVLHIATHGLFRPDNPFFSALKLADGWIDVRQIYRLPLRAQLVVLSACESGAVQVQGGDEAIGLARGFLGAGASSIVASLWNVHDLSAGELMDCFYARFTAADPGENYEAATALRAAQREAVACGTHPYYWASYVVIGN